MLIQRYEIVLHHTPKMATDYKIAYEYYLVTMRNTNIVVRLSSGYPQLLRRLSTL